MSESKDPPRLPDVVDEAGDSPKWLPWLGLAVLVAIVFGVIGRQAVMRAPDAPAPAAEEAPAPAEGEAK